jgi:hypothetical protein
VAARALANRLADRAIGQTHALADDHRLRPVAGGALGTSSDLSRVAL